MTLERGSAFTHVASATMVWPWGLSLTGGAAGGALFFLMNLSSGLGALPTALGAAVIFFALFGGVGGVVSRNGDRRGRRWATSYPFRYAAVPAGVGGAGHGTLPRVPGLMVGWTFL